MRLPRFEDAITRLDASWLLKQGYITDDTYNRVIGWLNGQDDKEIQRVVVSWMEGDADYAAKFLPCCKTLMVYFAICNPRVQAFDKNID